MLSAFRRRFPGRPLAVATAAALLAAPAAWGAATVEGAVSLSSGSSFAGGAGDFLHPLLDLWVGGAGEAASSAGRVLFDGGTQASFRALSLAQPLSTNRPLVPSGPNALRVDGSGTRLFTQGVSTGYGESDIAVTGGGLLDARSTACADKSFGFFFCNSRIGAEAGSRAALEVSGAGSVYTTRGLTIASAGTSNRNDLVGASVDVLGGATLRSWHANVAAGAATGSESTLGILRVSGPGSTWILDGYDSAANGAAPGGFTTAPYAIVGRDARGHGQLFIEDGGTLRLEKKEAASGAPFVFLGFGGPAQGLVTGTGSTLSFQAGTVGSLTIAAGPGGSSALTVQQGGQVLGAQFVGVGRARFVNGVQDSGGTGSLLVDGAGSLVRIDESTAQASGSNGALDIARGGGASGTVTVRNGGRIEILGQVARSSGPSLLIGREGGETGAPTGFTGSGVLNIQGAGSVVELRADSLAGGANPLVRVGRTGTGTGSLNISAGGQLVIDGRATSTAATPRTTSFIVGGSANVGGLTGGNGSALVTGAGSAVLMQGNDRFASVGDGPGANGQLTLSDGGRFHGGLFQVGRVRATGTATGTVVMNNGHMLLDGQFDSGTFATTGANLTVGTDAGSVGSVSMANGSTLQVRTDVAGRSASVNVGSSAGFAGGVGSLVVASGASIVIDGVGSSSFGIGTNGGSGSLVVDNGSITLAANGQARLNGSALLRNGASFSAGAYLGIGVDGGSGSLLLNDSSASAIEIVIGAGGHLGGAGGVLTGNLTNFGTFSPGASPGRFTILGNYKAEAGSRLVLEVESDGTGGFRTDEVIFGGTVDLAGLGIEFRFLGSTDPQAFANSGAFQIDHFLKTGDGGGLDDSVFAGVTFSAVAGDTQITGFSFDPAVGIPPAVPEPQTWAMALMGLLLLGGLARRRPG